MTLRNSPGRHEQVAVKVNAWADRGVAPLVEALAAIPGVISLESCQGGEVETPLAYVTFLYGDGWRAAGALLQRLSEWVGTRRPNLVDWELTLEWANGGAGARARCSCSPDLVEGLAAEFRANAAAAAGSGRSFCI